MFSPPANFQSVCDRAEKGLSFAFLSRYLSKKDDKLAKPNYQYEKRQKDLAKKRKQEEKRLRKLSKTAPPPDASPSPPQTEDDVQSKA